MHRLPGTRTLAVAARARRAVSREHARLRIVGKPPGSVVKLAGLRFEINDPQNFYVLYKDIFLNRIYHFTARTVEPVIIDGGSNIGAALLYFKKIYPAARVIALEPDPRNIARLHANLRLNRLGNVEVIEAALSADGGSRVFVSTTDFEGHLAHGTDQGLAHSSEVETRRLSEFLREPVDFLKLNIEGAETDVLLDAGDSLARVDQMVIEYHHIPGVARRLHEVLTLLHSLGFDYLLYDFDRETNPEVLPPFRLSPQSRYYLLIYATRLG